MGKYRKKPVVVEAHIFTGSTTSAGQIKKWIETGVYADAGIHTRDIRDLEIPTLEGLMTASPGDYIVRGLAGEFYPCKPDIFIGSYERIEEEDRQPGVYEAKNLKVGDIIDYCGSSVKVVNIQSYQDETLVDLADNNRISLRPWTEITVKETDA